jgi:hypothetical protein
MVGRPRCRRFSLAPLLLAVCASMALVSCSSTASSQDLRRAVFRVPQGFSGTAHMTSGTIYTVGVPPLHNLTKQAVHLRSVRLTRTGPYVHVLSYHAYSYRAAGGGVIAAYGDLPLNCPKRFNPDPISRVTIQPKADAGSFVLVTFVIQQVGTYKLGPFEIFYTVQGSNRVFNQDLSPGVSVVVRAGPVQSRYYKQFCQ